MNKILMTTFLVFLVLTGCKKSEESSQSGFFSSDETLEAAKIIEDANSDLKQVKAIYRKNQKRVEEELKPAMGAKDIDKVKSIADDLVLQINEGLVLGDEAIKKIKQAEELNINSTYKEYLRLKRESLEKQLEAFELRRQIAKKLSEIFGRKDPKEIDTVQAIFLGKEENFQKLIEEGKVLSQEANQIAKDAAQRQ